MPSKDFNHNEIVLAFERSGADVVQLHNVGGGVPDLLVGYCGVDQLVEIKLPPRAKAFDNGKVNPRTQLSKVQRSWHAAWKGRMPVVVRCEEDVERLLDSIWEERNDGS